MKMTTPKQAISLKCKDCNHDELSAGTFLEQTAACVCVNCPLHEHRPVPRSCRTNGNFDPAAIAAVREKLERVNRARAAR